MISLGDPTEREETTNYAREKIVSFINGKEYRLAILIAFIYASIRLNSLIADFAVPQKEKIKNAQWKLKAESVKRQTFSARLNDCKKYGLLHCTEYHELDRLRLKRNRHWLRK